MSIQNVKLVIKQFGEKNPNATILNQKSPSQSAKQDW
jgi:hypothetical protein